MAAQGTEIPAVRVIELAHTYNASAQDLFAGFVASPGNVVMSPYSIGIAMAMALSGARGTTETEMVAVLRHRSPRSEVDATNARLMAVLNSYQKTSTPPSIALNVANALVIPKAGTRLSPDYVATLRGNYEAELFENTGVGAVNEWVNRKTEGKIDRILDQLRPDVVAVLVNAIYFKATWETTFDKQATRNEVFNLSDSATAPVPMMHRQGGYAIVTGQGYKAIRLPYSGNKLAMVIVLPDEIGGAGTVALTLTADALATMVASLGPAQSRLVDLAMPRFKAGFRASLAAPFLRLGMTRAFSLADADFSGMTGRPPREMPIAIGEIVHRAVIEVAEEGTEAAAATAIGVRTTALRPLPVPFRVDRPFLFYVIDDGTGAILFQGRISDPRQD